MGKRVGATLLTAGLTAVAVLLSTGFSAAVSPDLTITPGGVSSWTAAHPSLGQVTCTKVTASFDFKSGSKVTNPVAKVTKATWKGCDIDTVSATITSRDLPWKLSLTSFDPSTGVWTGSLSKVAMNLSAPGCSATIEGTSADNGKANITYRNSTGVLTSPGTGNLQFSAVTGCFGLISNGDPASFKASGTLAPKQDITSS
jgi:hypothetical protein